MRAPEGSEFGTGAALRRIAGVVDARGAPPAPEPEPGRRGRVVPPNPLAPPPPLTDGYDEALFAPTDRPDEPITAGVPFGPGPGITRLPSETDRAFALRVADLLEQRPEVSERLRAYIDKLRAGG
jgi:hypothetical protein